MIDERAVTRPSLAVVIPFYNEQDNVAHVIGEVRDALGTNGDYEVIAVDDGSSDDTVAMLELVAARVPALRIVTLAQNRGQSSALANGVRAARAPLIATLDGDGQNPPRDIPRLVQAYQDEGADAPVLVMGWRQQRNDNLLRRLSSRFANRVRNALLGDGCPDTGCGLKVFARDDFLRLPAFDHMHRFLPALFVRDGGRVISVAVTHRPRRSGHSKYGVHNRLWVGLIDLAGVLWLQRRACRAEQEKSRV
ncbi:group 2 family glycosyl transferase [Salinisphaera sp. S4-8]|uniref:glycosyltransferase family 2 protein n=1 Tax=Salinisphaera sp. S4-8 TaxID=633357 RepID=UPI00333FA78F